MKPVRADHQIESAYGTTLKCYGDAFLGQLDVRDAVVEDRFCLSLDPTEDRGGEVPARNADKPNSGRTREYGGGKGRYLSAVLIYDANFLDLVALSVKLRGSTRTAIS
jgi:hypothetical protein